MARPKRTVGCTQYVRTVFLLLLPLFVVCAASGGAAVAQEEPGAAYAAAAAASSRLGKDAKPCNCTEVVCNKRRGGSCRNVTAPDGARCAVSKCRCGMFCFRGQCVGGEAIECPQHSLSPCKRYECVDATGKCSEVVNAPDGTPCPGGTCNGGTCKPIVCPPSPGPCVAYVYDAATGSCTLVPTNDGRSCDDDDRCTDRDVCRAGLCVGRPRRCRQPPSQCKQSRCNPATGRCTVTDKSDASPCSNSRCKVDQQCSSGQCTGGRPVLCPNNPQPCLIDTCSDFTGQCSTSQRPDGVPCPQGVCSDGVCVQTIPPVNVTCPPPPSYCQAWVYLPDVDPTQCVLVDVNDGNQCDDGIACTVGDVCRNGKCVGQPKVCPESSIRCKESSCDEASGGQCVVVNAPNRTPCSASLCRTNQVCLAGSCRGGFPVLCPINPEPCKVNRCSNTTGTCVTQNSIDGSPCLDDGVCRGGTCVQVTPPINVTCPPDPSPCTVYVFDPDINPTECILRPGQDGTPCEDGRACTVDDECFAGECQGRPKTCTVPDGFQCVSALCEEETGRCTLAEAPDGQSCDDGNPCTELDSCKRGVCSGQPKLCGTHSNPCKSLECDPTSGICTTVNRPDGLVCEDGFFCTVGDVCVDGVCSGVPRPCPPPATPADQCRRGVCNEATRECGTGPLPDGTLCDIPGTGECTLDSCRSGQCVQGPAVNCTFMDDPCNQGRCNPADGTCSREPLTDGTPCDDGLFCTTPGTAKCTAGQCGGGSPGVCMRRVRMGECERPVCDEELNLCATVPVDCSQFDSQCTVGVCNPLTGSCSSRPAREGQTCDDGKFCTIDDACVAGVCVGTPRACPPTGNACNERVCNAATDSCEIVNMPDGTGCTAGADRCTANTCLAGECMADMTSTTNCSALTDECNLGVCDPATGDCVKQPRRNFAPCTINGCLVDSFCLDGSCSGGSPRVCPASACETRTCNPATGQCDLTGTKDCSSFDTACTVGRCNAATGNCFSAPANDGASCDDGLYCTVDTKCREGVCAGGSARDCYDPTQPCLLGTCNELAERCDAIPKDCSTLNGPCVEGQCVADGNCVARPRPDGTTCDVSNGTATCEGSCIAGTCNQSCPVPPVTCRNDAGCRTAGGGAFCCCDEQCTPIQGGSCDFTCANAKCRKSGRTCNCIKSCKGNNCNSAGGNPCRSNGVCCCAYTPNQPYENSCVNCRDPCNKPCTGNLPPGAVNDICLAPV